MHYYVIDAKSIVGPLIAVSDMDVEKDVVFAIFPYHDWNKYFSCFIDKCKS